MKKIALLFLLFIAYLTKPVGVKAVWPDGWLVEGSQNELWAAENDVITGYSQHHFTDSFLVSDPDTQPVPADFVFRFRMTPIRGIDHNFVWNYQDPSSYYQAHFNGGAVWVTRFRFDQEVLSVAKNFPISLGQTYLVELTQDGSHVSLVIDGQEIIVFDDWTHNVDSAGSLGFKLSPGATIPVETSFEQILIHDAQVTLLPISHLRQDDPAWSEEEYDIASEWSLGEPPTIGRWGCALTSLTMIMRYHGLGTMPDGSAVDPLMVNNWLKQQADGYVGEGLLNWFAAMRLTREISERYSVPGEELPKLEFSYQGQPWRETAKNEILSQRPVIAQVPGHFTVVNGYDQRNDGFLITDPLYDYNYLSQHKSVLSLRLFKPSQTDLSALVIVHRPRVEVSLNNPAAVSWEERLETIDGVAPEPWFYTVIFKPTAGVYQLDLVGMIYPSDVQVFAYDEQAKVMVLAPPEDFDDGTYLIDFAKTGESSWTDLPPPPVPVFSWESFIEKLDQLKAEQKLSQPIFNRLKILAQFASATSLGSWSRYKHYLSNLLEFYQAEIDQATKEALFSLLE